MSTKITKRAIPHPTEAPNRKSVESLQVAVNELTGAVGENMQRAVRVCELVESGILALQPNGQLGRNESIDQLGTIDMSDVTGLTAALNARVLKAGDTMTGALTMKARVLSDRANNEWALLARSADAASDRGGVWVDAQGIGLYNANFTSAVRTENDGTVSLRAGSVTRAILQAAGTFDSFYGMRVFNASQLKVYDSNGDVPIELGLGFSSGADRNGYLWNRNNGFLSFGTNNTERMRIQAGGNVVTTGGALIVQNNDIHTYRAGGTTGVIFLNSSGTKYLSNDGARYRMPAQGLQVGGPIYSDSQWIEGTSGGQGWQMVWNVLQSGQGRTEYINNRGGGSGGFTWWDRANTGAGTGSALALLNANGYFVNAAIQFATGSATVGQLSSHPVFGTDYATLMGATMTGQEYVVLFNRAGADANTYISSITGGTVKIRPSANSTTGEVTFATTGVTFAQACTAPNFTATSDERLKDVSPRAPGYYPRIGELQLAEWTWKKDGKPGRGVVAQQVRDVAPGYVHENPTTGILSVDKAGLALELAMLALNLHRSCPCCSATKT